MTHLNLSIKDVPELLAQRLRERAASNHRSLQGELMAIIEMAAFGQDVGAQRPEVPLARMPARPSAARAAGPARRRIEDIARAHRQRFPQAIASGPQAVDIVRAERDSR